MATENIELDYLAVNQSQKEDVFNENMNKLDSSIKSIDDRLVIVENNGGGGGGGIYDDTELRNRIEQNESDILALQNTETSQTDDIEALKTSSENFSSSISALQSTQISQSNKISELEDADVIHDTDINSLEDRVYILENAGGSGYNDTELRNRIINNEDSIASINESISDIETSIDSIGSINTTQNARLDDYQTRIEDLEESGDTDISDIENRVGLLETDMSNVKTSQTNIINNVDNNTTRITALENGSGGGGGGSDVPQIGEVRQFVREYIPSGWSELSLAPVPIDDTYEWIYSDKNNGWKGIPYMTSNLSSFIARTDGLFRFNKDTAIFDQISTDSFSDLSSNYSYRVKSCYIQNNASDTLYIYKIDINLNSTLIEYDLINNNYTTVTNTQNVSGLKTSDSETFYMPSKNGDIVYTLDALDIVGDLGLVTKYVISTDTFTYSTFDIASITNSNKVNYYFNHMYFDDNGNIILNDIEDSVAIKIDAGDLSVSDVSSDNDILYSTVDFEIVESSYIQSYFFWIGDDQLMIRKSTGDMVNTKDNGSYLKYKDQFDINMKTEDGSNITDFWFDEDGSVYRSLGSSSYTKNVKKIDGALNVIDNNVVYCVYNGTT